MSMIKSALELAMERTQNIAVDTGALAMNEAKQDGKRLAGEYLGNPAEVHFAAKFSALPKDKKNYAKEGAFDVFVSRIQLPMTPLFDPESELKPLIDGLKALVSAPFGEKRLQAVFSELGAFLKQYTDDSKKVEEAIRKQYLPRLKQREQEMAARLGRAVRIDPMSDPEFLAFYKQNVGQMRAQYQDALTRVKSELAALCGIAKSGD